MDQLQKHTDRVQLIFRHTEKEYLAAMRLYVWQSKELLARIILTYALFSAGLVLLSFLINFSLPPWFLAILILLGGVAWFHGNVIDVPRRYFRGDPKFREEYNLTFTDAGIEFKTEHINSSMAWSLYTNMIENDSFYILIYGKGIHSLSILPKRAFRDSEQETKFRQMLRRNLNPALKLSDGEREKGAYVPTSLGPPDWR